MLRIRGQFVAAEAAFDEAIGFGHEPQPGLALLWLARGRTDAAAGAARRLLAEPRDPVHRSQLLPAAIEILLATGSDVDAARLLVEELTGIAIRFRCAAALFLSEKTVARHLSNIFTKIDVHSRTAAAAYAFEHHVV